MKFRVYYILIYSQILYQIIKIVDNKEEAKILAKVEDMSVSSFHSHFKKITAYTPYQYNK